MRKSDYQLVKRGPYYSVEVRGRHLYTSRKRGEAEGYLRMVRGFERQQREAKKAHSPDER